MAIRTVGPTSSFPTIAAAMLAAGPGDTIQLETGYRNETATVTHNGMIVSGDATSTGIVLQLGTGIATFTLTGTAPINVLDAPDGNGIVGNGGNNIITVTDGADAVDGGLGTDRLVVDYHLATGAVTGDSTSNFAEAGGSRLVTITNGTFENFTVLTGSGADTITTAAGDDIIDAGNGANTITAGQGANSIRSGSGADTITALDGGNFIDAGNGTNTITSGNGNDIIFSGVGADTIIAGGGNDVITVQGGADTVNSGAGDDRVVVDYSALTSAVTGGVTGGNLGSGYVGHIADSAGNSVDFVSTEDFTITTGSGNDIITTGDGIDVLSGGAGNDLLNSGGGKDTLAGGTGNDTLTGGTGDDRFVYAPGGGADIFTDFVAGAGTEDKIDLMAFTNIHTFGDVLARATPSGLSGTDTLIDFGNGDTITLQHVAKTSLSADDFVIGLKHPPNHDFNGDGTSDILWSNDDGRVDTWLLNNDQYAGGTNFGKVATSGWHIAGTGDFNGDGTSDLLWRNDDGRVDTWVLNNDQYAGGTSFGKVATSGWQVAGTGDFNGDGTSDLLWHNDDGRVDTWLLNNDQHAGGTTIGAMATSWHIEDTQMI